MSGLRLAFELNPRSCGMWEAEAQQVTLAYSAAWRYHWDPGREEDIKGRTFKREDQ